MAARVKVFSTSNGLTESLIAVGSRAKALEAWGATQDLFKQGLARETDDPAAVALATAKPGQVVTRSVLDKAALEAALAALPRPRGNKTKPGKPDKKRGPSKDALARVAKFEAKLVELEKRHHEALDDIARRRVLLDDEERDLRGAYAARRREIEGRLTAARDALADEG